MCLCVRFVHVISGLSLSLSVFVCAWATVRVCVCVVVYMFEFYMTGSLMFLSVPVGRDLMLMVFNSHRFYGFDLMYNHIMLHAIHIVLCLTCILMHIKHQTMCIACVCIFIFNAY